MSYPTKMLYSCSDTEGYVNKLNTSYFNIITPVDIEFAPNETKQVDFQIKSRGFDIYSLLWLDNFYVTNRTILNTETPLTSTNVDIAAAGTQIVIPITNTSSDAYSLIAGTEYFQIKHNQSINFGARMVDPDHISMMPPDP